MKLSEIVTATQAELDELLARAKPTFTSEQYLLLERVLATFVYVMGSLQSAKASVKRLQHMLFGQRTEHKHHVLGALAAAGQPQTPEADATDRAPDPDPGAVSTPPRARPPGHGRNAAQAYSSGRGSKSGFFG